MKKTRLALAISASMIAATPAMATNGDNLIGLGAQSRALGGTGTAAFFGSENALNNPALLAKAKENEISFGGTLFKPSVKADSGMEAKDSAADTNVIPEVSIVNSISDDLSFGIGMFGSAGMGVDYTGAKSLYEAQSNLQLMKFAPSLSYKTGSFGIGFAPVLQYGALDINYKMARMVVDSANTTNPPSNFTFAKNDGTTTDNQNDAGIIYDTVGSGVTSDLGWGYNLGAYFDLSKGLTLALAYQSAIDMKYKNQMSTASQPFAQFGFLPSAFGDNLEQPSEISAGVAYTMGNLLLTGDYKKVAWGSAKGYKDFNWQDQDVIAIGAKYSGKGYWIGAGYNKADDPIKKSNNATVNMFNNLFFPAFVETHFTLGGGYSLSKTVSLDAAIVMASEKSKAVDTSQISSGMATAIAGSPQAVSSSEKTTHSQIGYTVSVRYDF